LFKEFINLFLVFSFLMLIILATQNKGFYMARNIFIKNFEPQIGERR